MTATAETEAEAAEEEARAAETEGVVAAAPGAAAAAAAAAAATVAVAAVALTADKKNGKGGARAHGAHCNAYRHPFDFVAGDLFHVSMGLAPGDRLRLAEISDADRLGRCRLLRTLHGLLWNGRCPGHKGNQCWARRVKKTNLNASAYHRLARVAETSGRVDVPH